LRHLELSEYRPFGNNGSVIESTTVAFVFRHMPLLENLEFFSGTEKGIRLLHKETEEARVEPGIFQEGFEKACRDVIHLHGLVLRNPNSGPLQELPISTFSGWYRYLLSYWKRYINLTFSFLYKGLFC